MTRSDAYGIDSVSNALRALLYLRDREQVRVSDLSAHLGVAVSTAHRLLATLRANNFVEQVPGAHTYRLSPLMGTFSHVSPDRSTLVRVARPALVRLCQKAGETANLLVLEGPSVRFIDGVETMKPLRVAPRTGDHLPAHCTAGGKAMLSLLPPEQVRVLLGRKLSRLTGQSIGTHAALRKELAETRERGYAINLHESVVDVAGVGVPVLDRRGRCVAAVTVSGPASRIDQDTAASLSPLLRAAAQHITARL